MVSKKHYLGEKQLAIRGKDSDQLTLDITGQKDVETLIKFLLDQNLVSRIDLEIAAVNTLQEIDHITEDEKNTGQTETVNEGDVEETFSCNHCSQTFEVRSNKYPANHDCPEKYPNGYEPGKAEEETTNKPSEKPPESIDLKERYPLDRDTVRGFSKKRLEYELVIFFKSKKNSRSLDTYEVMEAVWNWGNIDSQTHDYKRVQSTMEQSKMFRSNQERPKKYFLSPNSSKDFHMSKVMMNES